MRLISNAALLWRVNGPRSATRYVTYCSVRRAPLPALWVGYVWARRILAFFV